MMIPKHEFTIVFAYIDPGSGFLMLQMVAGAILGAWFYFGRSVARFAARVLGRPQPERTHVATAETVTPVSDSQ
jgi:hypothetical protein